MTHFDDVCKKYEQILNKYIKLRILLIKKLKNQKVTADFNNLSFEELINLVDTIPTDEYDIIGNYKPSSNIELEPFKTHMQETQIITDISISNYNEALAKKTLYYIQLLRYYLAAKGVNLYEINQARTLEDHILLIDFIPRYKNTTINVVLNEDNNLYYGTNIFTISIIDENNYPVTNGGIIYFYKDGLRIKQSISDEIIIDIDDLEKEHNYSFQFHNVDGQYLDSNIVNFNDIVSQAMPIDFYASIINLMEREYFEQTFSLKGYLDDEWAISSSMYNIRNEKVFLPIKITIYDPERIIESNSFDYEYINFLRTNNENNNQPIKITFEPIENEYYIFNNTLIEFYINILYPAWKVIPTYDYACKNQYQFDILLYDEYTGERTNAFDNETMNVLFYQDEVLLIENSYIIENGRVTVEYNDSLITSEYILDWSINDIKRIQKIKILPNIEYSEEIYLIDEPFIKIINDVDITDIEITVTTYKDEETNYDDEEEEPLEQSIILTGEDIDNEGYVILPNEYKEVGIYYVSIDNHVTGEQFDFNYQIKEPYTYYMEGDNSYKAFYITIDDLNDFDYENIYDYITISEYGHPLEYQYVENYSDQITVIADKEVNHKFKGLNTFIININNYIQTETFKLLDETEGFFEILDGIEIGDNEVTVACYYEGTQEITVTISHNENIIGTHIINSDDEYFVFNQNFPEEGDYTFNIVGDNDDIQEQYTIHLDKNILKIQDIKIKEKFNFKDTPDDTNCLGFGFKESNKINENIDVVFYYDNPSNILAIKTINAQDYTYYTYLDIFLGDIPFGHHTLYAWFNGDSDYYQEFLISKEFYNLHPTQIIYDGETIGIEIGDPLPISLITIDNENNIVKRGKYIINGVEYELDDDITITASLDNTFYVQYIGEDEYDDCEVTVNYSIYSMYDYYASSLIGDNLNNGLSPVSPVLDIDTILNISESTDVLCLMEGEYQTDIITRDTIFYGYHHDSIDTIKTRINKLAPHTKLIIKNISLDTGEGYVNVVGTYEFVNSSDEVAKLSTVIKHAVVPNPIPMSQYTISLVEDNIATINDNAVINGVITKNGQTIANKLIKLYKYDELIKATISGEHGEFSFNITTDKTVTMTLKGTECQKSFLVNYLMTYHPLLNGNEELITLQEPLLNIQNGELTGGVGFINAPWSNLMNWKLEFDFYGNISNTGVALYPSNTIVRENSFIQFTNDGQINLYWHNNNQNLKTYVSCVTWTHVEIQKINDYTLIFNYNNGADGGPYTVEWQNLVKYIEWCIGIDSWRQGNYSYIKNIYVSGLLPEEFYTNQTYKIKLNGTEALTMFETTYPTITTMRTLKVTKKSESGYLSEGFKNTKFWEINCEAKCSYSDAGIGIYNKGESNVDFNSALINKSGQLYTFTNGTRWQGQNEASETITPKRWTSVRIRRVSSQTIAIKIGDGDEIRTGWPGLINYEYLCIGIQSWGATIELRNIEIKIFNK